MKIPNDVSTANKWSNEKIVIMNNNNDVMIPNDIDSNNVISSDNIEKTNKKNKKKRKNEHLSTPKDGSKQPNNKKRIGNITSTDKNTSNEISNHYQDLNKLQHCQPTNNENVNMSTLTTNISQAWHHTKRNNIDSHHSVLPLSMKIMKPFWVMCCQNCERTRNHNSGGGHGSGSQSDNKSQTMVGAMMNHHSLSTQSLPPPSYRESVPSFVNNHGDVVMNIEEEEEQQQEQQQKRQDEQYQHLLQESTTGVITTKENDNSSSTMNQGNTNSNHTNTTNSEQNYDQNHHIATISPTPKVHTNPIMQEYISTTQIYGCKHINAGVLTAIRFSLPTLRVSGSFHDSDMLALSEILFRHCNGSLKHIKRLDFSVASREGKLHGKKGFGSHGAFTLSRVLYISKYIEEVFVPRNRIGPYGAAAIFAAAGKNSVLRTLVMRRCCVGERGALAFAEYIGDSKVTGLREVDLSVNRIGFRGSIAIEEMLNEREESGDRIDVDLEGNLVLQEVMNGVTHGLGVILSIIGAFLLSKRASHHDRNHVVSCGVYSVSLVVLYTSSTLYHSFFALKITRYIFEVLDHCAIYILITGSYTPFLRIALEGSPYASYFLLIFQWTCCICGIFVEAFYNSWVHKPKFSLAMYLAMGWACVVCMPQFMEVLPKEAIQLLVLGGVGYTSGVPFFVRNNNLDHSIWHCFVLAGSIFHWFAVYNYVAPMNSCVGLK